MSKHNSAKRLFVQFSAALIAAAVMAGNQAHAQDAQALDLSVNLDEVLERIDADVTTDDAEIVLHAEDWDLPDLQPRVVSFIKDCADVDAVPLLELSKRKDRRVFFGISFDGVLGIHARL